MNKIEIKMAAQSINESFARMAASAYMMQMDPTLEDLADVKTAVSEAVTNAIIHGYGGSEGIVSMVLFREGNMLTVEISDEGRGIADIEKAREPLYTSCPGDERSGMGFTVMETFMDSLEVESRVGEGTWVRMTKTVGSDG